MIKYALDASDAWITSSGKLITLGKPIYHGEWVLKNPQYFDSEIKDQLKRIYKNYLQSGFSKEDLAGKAENIAVRQGWIALSKQWSKKISALNPYVTLKYIDVIEDYFSNLDSKPMDLFFLDRDDVYTFDSWIVDENLLDELISKPRKFVRYSKVITAKTFKCYHGTYLKFDQFEYKVGIRSTVLNEWEVNTGGFFFSTHIKDAKEFGKYIVECKIKLNNPLFDRSRVVEFSQKGLDDLIYIAEPLFEYEGDRVFLNVGLKSIPIGFKDTVVDQAKEWVWQLFDSGYGLKWGVLDDPEISKRMKERGYDGTFVYEPGTFMEYSLFVIDPSQIQIVKWIK